MNTFLKLNLRKIRFAYIVSVVSLLSFTAIILLIAYLQGHHPYKELLAAILFTDIFVSPILIISIGYFIWTINRFKRNQAFLNAPFDKLDEIGFQISLKNEKTKWHFTEEVKEAIINGFQVQCDVIIDNGKYFEFEMLNTFKQIDSNEYHRLEKLLSEYSGYFKFDTVAKRYQISKADKLNVRDIKIELQQFTIMLKQEGF